MYSFGRWIDGAMEVNDAAMNANLKGQIAKAAGGAYVDTEGAYRPDGYFVKVLCAKWCKYNEFACV